MTYTAAACLHVLPRLAGTVALLAALSPLAACQTSTPESPPRAETVAAVADPSALPVDPYHLRFVDSTMTTHLVFDADFDGDIVQQVARAFADGLDDGGFRTALFRAPEVDTSARRYEFYVFVARAFTDLEGDRTLRAIARIPELRGASASVIVFGDEADPQGVDRYTSSLTLHGAVVLDALAVGCDLTAINTKDRDERDTSCDPEYILSEMYSLGACTAHYWEQQ